MESRFVINLAKDLDNPGKVIASTVIANTTYYIAGSAVSSIMAALIGGVAAAFGLATAPVWMMIGGALVGGWSNSV